jgi:hypothetical protein
VADIIVAGSMQVALQLVLDGGFRKAMPNFSAWATRYFSLPQVIQRLGNIRFCAKAIKA